MKKKYLNVMVWAMMFAMSSVAFSACSDEDGDKDGDGGDGEEMTEIVVEDGETLNGKIEKGNRVVLSAGNSYKLSGGYTVEEGAELKIEEGVTVTAVEDDNADYILVKQGGKIDAQGTAEKPIVMTSELKEPTGWGGIHICGYSHTNRGEGAISEIGNAPYGGDKEDDNSGILRYIRLEYTGFAFDAEHESNGVSFYGVGSGTIVEHLQAYKGADDGFEFFGGSVNVKYLVATGCEDDSFDWTEGWNGKAQFLVATQEGTSGETVNEQVIGDCLIEADNNGDNAVATPVSCPTLANLTLIGNDSEDGKRGIRLRAGTYAKIYNTIITGKPQTLTVETSQTEESLVAGKSVLSNVTMSGDFNSKEGIYTLDMFTSAGNVANSSDIVLNGLVGVIEGGADLSSDSFFAKAEYRGAVKAGEDWTAGWTK